MERDFAPIFYFCLVISVLAVLNFVLEYKLILSLGKTYPTAFIWFTLIAGGIHFVTGMAVILRLKFGLWLLKGLLYFYYLGFPFGTMFSRWMLGYIKKNNIERYFT